MPGIIQLLPDALANQIAAGEVVQRPASVVKELLENSIDAGASEVGLSIKQAGKALIQVTDNGCGMAEVDARMCFERHATSKIKNLQDLFSVLTYGFRGEALASIAAVAQVSIKTRPQEQDTGVVMEYEGSHLKHQGPTACPKGTVISVRNLFFNVPARRNFLKSNAVETRHITDEFIRVALAYPHISFQLRNEGDTIFQLPGGKLRQRIIGVFGKKYDKALVPVEEQTSILNISGFVGKPEVARKSRGEQYFFVNHRYVRHPYLNHAVSEAFGALIAAEHHPFYVLFLEIAPQRVDINVHPTKTEVKFDDERAIYAMLSASIRRALSQYQIAPSLNFEQQDPLNPGLSWTPGGSQARPPDKSGDWGIDPAKAGSGAHGPGGIAAAPAKTTRQEWEQFYQILHQDLPEQSDQQEHATLRFTSSAGAEGQGPHPEAHIPRQLMRKYIMAPIKSGLLLVDQHRAHQRILYEQYQHQMDGVQTARQQQLFPQEIEVSGSELAYLKLLCARLESLGFELELPQEGRIRFTGLPASAHRMDLAAFVQETLDAMGRHGNQDENTLHEVVLRQLARGAAVSAGQLLDSTEMQHLIDQLFACKDPYFTPEGKATLVTIPGQEIEQRFGG